MVDAFAYVRRSAVKLPGGHSPMRSKGGDAAAIAARRHRSRARSVTSLSEASEKGLKRSSSAGKAAAMILEAAKDAQRLNAAHEARRAPRSSSQGTLSPADRTTKKRAAAVSSGVSDGREGGDRRHTGDGGTWGWEHVEDGDNAQDSVTDHSWGSPTLERAERVGSMVQGEDANSDNNDGDASVERQDEMERRQIRKRAYAITVYASGDR